MASILTLPASYGGYVTSSALSSLGLTQTTTPGGGTGYKDASGNIYTFNGSQFVPLSVSAGGGAPASSSAPSSTPTSSSPSSQSGAGSSGVVNTGGYWVPSSGTARGANQPIGQQITYNGTTYIIASNANPYQYLVNNNIAPASAFTAAQLGVSSTQGTSATPSGQGSAINNPNASVIGLPALAPGDTGQNVLTLQNWLVQNGYMTQAQMNTGPGTYGPQTKAAVAAWQSAAGINTQGNPGYFGPISQQYLSQSGASYNNGIVSSGSGSGSGSAGTGDYVSGSTIPGTDIPSTGNSNLDSILSSLSGLISSGKAVIPPGLQITPALAQQFLTWAHQVVDPQTQQLMAAESASINASLANQVTQFQNQQGEDIQQFGMQLAGQDNAAGASGTAFSGLHNVQDQNLVNSTNRTLSSLNANTNYGISSALQQGGAALGSANAGSLNVPTLTGATVGLTGGNLSGSQGSSSTGQTLDFSYNPSIYTAGTIPSSQSTAVSNLAGNYLSQYGTLAGANSGQSISSLIGGISGLPSNYQIPSNLT